MQTTHHNFFLDKPQMMLLVYFVIYGAYQLQFYNPIMGFLYLFSAVLLVSLRQRAWPFFGVIILLMITLLSFFIYESGASVIDFFWLLMHGLAGVTWYLGLRNYSDQP